MVDDNVIRQFYDKMLYTGDDKRIELLYKKELSYLYNKKKKVSFINGCFDIIHPMHIELFWFAKDISDCLVVAVNSDEYIKKHKGNGRPIHKLEERITILASLEPIDFIINFTTECPGDIINIIKPTYLIKGPEYTFEKLTKKEQNAITDNNIKLMNFPENESTR